MNTKDLRLFPLVLSALLFYPVVAGAQWQLDGTALSTAPNGQAYPMIVSDGAGGAIVAWEDYRSGAGADVYVQRIDALGAAQWTANGVALCTAANNQYDPRIVTDGHGGAIVTWRDYRNGTRYDIYAQRVNALGAVQWTANGVALCTAANNKYEPAIVADGGGGAIVTWRDYRSGNYDIYAQRVNISGTVQWTADGIALCAATSHQYSPTIAADGSGGAIVTWRDHRNGTNYNLYAQRVKVSGVVQWTADGVALCTAADDKYDPTIVADGSGGAIVTWRDYRSGTDYDIYAQRVNASGAVQWTADGVALCMAADDQLSPTIASDGAGGAIVTWVDYRSGTDYDIYAQRANASGTVQWMADGVALCTAADGQLSPTIASDGAGGAIVTWYDYRSGNYDIYAQRVNASGAVRWTADGVALCTAATGQIDPTILSDGSGGAIVSWADPRSGTFDIYAQRVEGVYGYWYAFPPLVSVTDVPGDQGGWVKVNWTASDDDIHNLQMITHYSVWRATDAVAAASAAVQGNAVRSPSEVPGDFRGKAVWTQHASGTDYYWEWLANVDAHYLSAYSYTAATRSDSTGQGSFDESFFVSAHTTDPFVFFDSNVLTGHSVDNLAPTAPLYLTAQRVGSDVYLQWKAVHVADLKDYAVYRGTSSGVTPVEGNFLANEADTVLVDANAPTSVLYYIVTAKDVHGNESAPSNEASVSSVTGVGHTPALTALAVRPNRPNPFSGTTELEVGLPAASAIHIAVYDVAGRLVRTEDVAGAAGWQSVRFGGSDARGKPLASGVYFYKVTAGGETVTRKMLIAR